MRKRFFDDNPDAFVFPKKNDKQSDKKSDKDKGKK